MDERQLVGFPRSGICLLNGLVVLLCIREKRVSCA